MRSKLDGVLLVVILDRDGGKEKIAHMPSGWLPDSPQRTPRAFDAFSTSRGGGRWTEAIVIEG